MRKHLPKMSMVMEEDSAYEASVMASQHNMSTHNQSQYNMAQSVMSYNTKSKFIYKEPISAPLLNNLDDD